MEPNADVDAMVADAVRNIRDRFGPEGLRDLVTLANVEIDRSERAVEDLGALVEPSGTTSAPVYDSADTQAWIAYTDRDPEPASFGDSDADGDGD
ncbi:MAG TPA: hypothetical protein VK585_16875 [Jiangellaceae bacterium]|nr:hypothetical protein [Jiangellaceae bacterium]